MSVIPSVLFILSLLGCLFADHIPTSLMENATSVFAATVFPCVSNCGSDTCIASSWDEAAARSRNLTVGCKNVLYSVAIDERADSFNHIPQYWGDSLVCSILFLSDNSAFFVKNPSASTLGNWTVIAVKTLNAFANNRKAVKIPKFFPHAFFADGVEHALFVDAKIRMLDHPAVIMQKHLIPYKEEGTFLTLVAHPNCPDLVHDVDLLLKLRHERPNVTFDLPLLFQQRDTYTALNITGQGRMVDTAVLMHNIRSTAARSFFCTWQGQVQKFSDRDQIAFQGTVGWFTRNFTDSVTGRDGTVRVGVNIDGHLQYLRILPRKQYHFAHGRGRFARIGRQHWN